jgi:hypothetical protein
LLGCNHGLRRAGIEGVTDPLFRLRNFTYNCVGRIFREDRIDDALIFVPLPNNPTDYLSLGLLREKWGLNSEGYQNKLSPTMKISNYHDNHDMSTCNIESCLTGW